jgi:hypothetical protein
MAISQQQIPNLDLKRLQTGIIGQRVTIHGVKVTFLLQNSFLAANVEIDRSYV